MRTLMSAVLTLAILVPPAYSTENKTMINILRIGTAPSAKGPSEYFTGTVRIDSPFQSTEPARTGGALVTFEPSARTAWHTHPLGQTLIVTAGSGLVQEWNGPVREIRLVILYGYLPGLNTGMAQHLKQRCLILP